MDNNPVVGPYLVLFGPRSYVYFLWFLRLVQNLSGRPQVDIDISPADSSCPRLRKSYDWDRDSQTILGQSG